MKRSLKSLSSRVVIAALIIHAVLLPILFYGLLTVVRHSEEEMFVDQVRIFSRVFADTMDTDLEFDSEAELIAHLDSAILGGTCMFAALELGDRLLVSSLMQPEDAEHYAEDFRFGENDDGVYYTSAPLQFPEQMAILKFGFDEGPTTARIESARGTILFIIIGYLVVSLSLVTFLANIVTGPLQRLRRVSREIASGDYGRKLSVDSNILEINELGSNLENMRSALVGVNARLQQEIADREAAQAEQRKVEGHMRHMQRLQSIGTLAGGVAHEFNNVLLPILMYIDLALEDLPTDSPTRSKLERVMRLANRAKNLSQQILTFGRRSTEVTQVALDVAPVIEEALSMVRAMVPANIEIRTDIEHQAGTIVCDPAEIQQLVVNLCSNAYHSMLKGGGHMTVSLKLVDSADELSGRHLGLSDDEYLRLRVADTGVGMDPPTLQRIFEPFFTKREVGQGTGLGLSVVHGIVERHDGKINVSSEVNGGTTVDIYFPLGSLREILSQEEHENDQGYHH